MGTQPPSGASEPPTTKVQAAKQSIALLFRDKFLGGIFAGLAALLLVTATGKADEAWDKILPPPPPTAAYQVTFSQGKDPSHIVWLYLDSSVCLHTDDGGQYTFTKLSEGHHDLGVID